LCEGLRGTIFGQALSHVAKVASSGLFPFFNESVLGKRTQV